MSLTDYLPLCERLGLAPDLPYTPKWSAAADFLALIVEHVLTHKPATIVECGSGMTSLMLARCCALNGTGHVYSLENGADFAANTRAAVARHGLQAYSTIIDAPLMNYTLNGQDYQWYDIRQLNATNIEMLVIDGPPGFLQRHSRYPALPLLSNRLGVNFSVFLDDAARPDEQGLITLWRATYPLLEYQYIANERGCALLQSGSDKIQKSGEA